MALGPWGAAKKILEDVKNGIFHQPGDELGNKIMKEYPESVARIARIAKLV